MIPPLRQHRSQRQGIDTQIIEVFRGQEVMMMCGYVGEHVIGSILIKELLDRL